MTDFGFPTNFKRRAQLFCVNGHEFTAENTYWSQRKARGRRKAGRQRSCRICKLQSNKLWAVYKRKDYSRRGRHDSAMKR